MQLYHYTAASLADLILMNSLSEGHLNSPNGMEHKVIWLTSDPTAEGHGLTNGKSMLSDSQLRYSERSMGQAPKNRFTMDKMKVRLSYDIPEHSMTQLFPFVEYCSKLPDGQAYAKRMGLSCYMNLNGMKAHQLRSLMKSFKTKETTWWISFMPVSSAHISAVHIRDKAGTYVPYEFEKLARPALKQLGLVSPPAAALSELRNLVSPVHPLIEVKASVFCQRPDTKPEVFIRGCHTSDLFFDIETGNPHVGNAGVHAQISAWIIAHRQALLDAWAEARESYYHFYPKAS